MRRAGYQGWLGDHDVVLHDPVGGWASGPVVIARTGRERRRGLKPRPVRSGMLFRASAVHGFGMQVPLGVAGIDDRGRVVAVGRLDPGRVLRIPGARWILETPPSHPLPPPGSALVVRPMLPAWPDA